MSFPPFDHARWLADAWTGGAPRHDLGASGFRSRVIHDHLPPAVPEDAGHMDLHAGTRLRDALAGHVGVAPESLRVTCGTTGANAAAIAAFVRPGTRVLCERPTYLPLAHVATGMGARLRFIDQPAGPDPGPFLHELDHETTAILLTSPNNPTQRAWTRAQFEELGDAAARRGTMVIVDQVYRELTDHARAEHPSIVSTSGLNKCWGAPGLRIGWMTGDPRRLDRAWDAHMMLSLAPSAYGARAAEALLPHAAAFRADLEDHLRTVHAAYRRWCKRQGIDDEPRGLTAFPAWPGDSLAEAKRLLKQGVLTVPGDFFGRPGHLRIGFGAPDVEASLAALVAAS